MSFHYIAIEREYGSGGSGNYDIILNSGGLGVEGCVQVLKGFLHGE